MRAIYEVILEAKGVASGEAVSLIGDLKDEFRRHRPWQRHVRLKIFGETLQLQMINDFDFTGLASLDEFGDVLAAYSCTFFDAIELTKVRRLGVVESLRYVFTRFDGEEGSRL